MILVGNKATTVDMEAKEAEAGIMVTVTIEEATVVFNNVDPIN